MKKSWGLGREEDEIGAEWGCAVLRVKTISSPADHGTPVRGTKGKIKESFIMRTSPSTYPTHPTSQSGLLDFPISEGTLPCNAVYDNPKNRPLMVN